MADLKATCPKCDRAMERGHVPDVTQGQVLQTRWSRGDPESRRFFGGIRWTPAEQIPLAAYRCPSCGYVEFYARPA